jgi:hypothetical protein
LFEIYPGNGDVRGLWEEMAVSDHGLPR